MKKFKNNNFVVHSDSVPLLDAIYREALELGWEDDQPWNKTWKDNKYNYLKFDNNEKVVFHNYNCGLKIYNLPRDWNKILELISEVVEPEVVKPVIKQKTPKELLIIEAEKKYPKGTKFTPAHVTQPDCVYTSTGKVFKSRSSKENILMHIEEKEGWSPVVSWGSVWAKIVEDEPITYSVGDRFTKKNNSCNYVLVQVDPARVQLINITEGNRVRDGIIVKDIFKITEEEFDEMCVSGDYKLIK